MLEVPQNGVENGEEAKAPAIALPFGDTLHYPSCGCPAGWQNTTRAADVVDILVQKAFQAYQEGRLAATRPLRVLYFLPHHNVTGGMKCLVEHVRLLKLRGECSCMHPSASVLISNTLQALYLPHTAAAPSLMHLARSWEPCS